jgi:hypothetical protein
MRILLPAALLLLLASQRAFAAAPNTVAIAMETNDVKIAADLQAGFAAEILYGLGEVFSNLARVRINLTQVSAPKISARILECADAECLQAVAQSANVDLVVQARVQTTKASKKGKPDYAVSMVVARNAPAHDAWREKADCQGCSVSEIKHMASLLASTIAEQIKIDAPFPAATPSLKPQATEAKLASAPVGIRDLPEKPGLRVPRYVSVAAIAVGVVLMGTGAYLASVDGKGTCDLAPPKEHCPERYRTQGLGFGLVAGGGLVALGGVVGLLFFSPRAGSTNLAIGFSPSSISLSGAF